MISNGLAVVTSTIGGEAKGHNPSPCKPGQGQQKVARGPNLALMASKKDIIEKLIACKVLKDGWL
jgi:hypothetical protein